VNAPIEKELVFSRVKDIAISRERGVAVAWARMPFDAAVPNYKFFPVGEKESVPTIHEIVASLPNDQLPLSFHSGGRVCVDGVEIPRSVWNIARPKLRPDGQISVTLHPAPLRKGSQTLAIIAAIALTVVTAGVGAGGAEFILGAQFAAGTFGAAALAGGIALGGSLLISSLSRPPSQSNASGQNSDSGQEPSSLQNNVLEKGGTVPRVLGTRRLYPPSVVYPYIELDGKDEWIETIFALSGPHKLEKLRAGNVLVEESEDFQVEMREGWPDDPPITLINRQTFTDGTSALLGPPTIDQTGDGDWILLQDQETPLNSITDWHTVLSRGACDKIVLVLAFQEGLLDQNSPNAILCVPFRMRIRPQGGSDQDWRNFPEFHLRTNNASPFKKVVEIVWGDPASIPTPIQNDSFYLAYKWVAGQVAGTFSYGGSNGALATDNWDAHPRFSAGAFNDYLNHTNASSTNVRNVALTRDAATFYLDEANFPKGKYEIQIKKGTIYSDSLMEDSTHLYDSHQFDFFSYIGTSSGSYGVVRKYNGVRHRCDLERVSAIWNDHPIPGRGDALIAIRAKNRSLGQISIEASGYVRDWNAEQQQWSDWKTTSCPAPHYYDVLTGDLNRRRLSPDMVSLSSILAWRERCLANNYKADLVCDGRAGSEVLELLAGCGFARPRQSDLWGVVIDRDRSGEGVIQTFTPLNSDNLTINKIFPDRPDAFRIKFYDRTNDYIEDELIVPRRGRTEDDASKFEAYTYPATVDKVAGLARADFDQAQPDYRPVTYKYQAGWDTMIAIRGDLVGLQSDMLARFGGFAWVREVFRYNLDENLVTGVMLDSEVPFPSGGDYFAATDRYFSESDDKYFAPGRMGVSLRLRGGGSHLITEVTPETDTNNSGERRTLLTFNTPVSDPDRKIARDVLATTGILGTEHRRVIITKITPRGDLKATIEAVDEGNGLFGDAAITRDFSETAAGAGTPAGWTKKPSTAPNYSIDADPTAFSGQRLSFTGGVNTDDGGLALDEIGTVTNGEALLLMKTGASETYQVQNIGAILRGTTDRAKPTAALCFLLGNPNWVENNSMIGAVAGAPGVLPDFWTDLSGYNGYSREIVGTGQEAGVDYIDVRFFGTTSGGGSDQRTSFAFTKFNSIPAANGQTWIGSAYLKLVAGGFGAPNFSYLAAEAANSSGAWLQGLGGVSLHDALTDKLTRYGFAGQITNPSAAAVYLDFGFSWSNGQSFDFVLRIGMPQLEQAGSPSPVQRTYGRTLNLGRVGLNGGLWTTAPFNWRANSRYWLRMKYASDWTYAKAWAFGDPEPDEWMIARQDSLGPDQGYGGLWIPFTGHTSQGTAEFFSYRAGYLARAPFPEGYEAP